MATRKKAPEPDTDEAGGRSLWKGSISFGLIDIPVSLHSAESPGELRFSMLDKRDLSPVKYERVSAKSGRPVPWEQVVKGYEYEEGRYVVISEEELRNANPEATQTVDIVAFVDGDEIPPEYDEKPYYLRPLKRGRKGYALLYEVLRKSGRVGIAKVVIRIRQHLAALIPRDGILVLELLRWAHELKDPGEPAVSEGALKALRVTPKELEMASRLVEGMVEKWKPEKHVDTYREDVMAYIEKKAKSGKFAEVEEPEAKPRASKGSEVIDFVSLLQRSLREKASKGAASAAARRRSAKPAHAAKKARSA
jgi:DNA end-binding protein Ku